MKQIILFLILVFWLSPVLAQAGSLGNKIEQNILIPVKQTIENLPQDIADGLSYLWGKLKGKKQQKQEEIKEEIKQEIKEEIQESRERAERKYLAPLKNKIQQGTDKIRQAVNSIKDFIISLF